MDEQEQFDTSESPPGPEDIVDIPEDEEPVAGDEEPAGEFDKDEPEDESDLDPAG